MGKQVIVYVVGLSTLLGYAILSMSTHGLNAQDTFFLYYARSTVHNIALGGANIGTHLCLNDPSYSTNLSNVPFNGGAFDVVITKSVDTTRIASIARLPIRHYDYTRGRWQTEMRDTVVAVIRRISFSRYGWFTEAEENGYVGSPYYGALDWKITGDSVFGPAHTNSRFNLAGTPYFHDKVTANQAPNLMALNGRKAPIYKSGFEWGIRVPRPSTNLSQLYTTARDRGGLLNTNGNDVALRFLPNGTVAVRIPPSTGRVRNDTVPLTLIAPNGLLVVNGGDLRVTGTYSGSLTVAALQGGRSGKGNVWIDGNGIIAVNSPRTNTQSTDMLGIVAENNTYISRDNSRNPSTVVNIDASIYCHNGELTAYQFWQIGKHGRVSLYGGVTQRTAGSLGVFSSRGLVGGFYYSIRHDTRFLLQAPPFFPASTKYQLVSWWEN